MAINIDVYKMPDCELDRTIAWLEHIRDDCDTRIAELTKMKSNRSRSKRHRLQISIIADRMIKAGDFTIDAEAIQRELECSYRQAASIAERVNKKVKRKAIEERDERIKYLANQGVSVAKIAKKSNITRQQVYNVIKKTKVVI